MKRRKELEGLEEEIRQHLERETQENVERGMTPEEARKAALHKFGNVARVQEETRAVWHRRWLEEAVQDAEYGLRLMRRNPRFALVVTLTLALGIGVSTAVFSVVNATLLKPLGHSRAEALVWLGDYDPNLHRDFAMVADFFDWRAQTKSYDGMAAYGYLQAVLERQGRAAQTTAIYVAGDFWKLTEARPSLGRRCGADEADCVVVSREFWEREYAGNAGVVGGPVSVNGRAAHLVGVLPEGFRLELPMWWVAQHPRPVEAFVSLPPPRERMAQSAQVFALLKPGIRAAQAQAELIALQKRLIEQGGRRAVMTGLHVQSLAEKLTGGSRRALAVLMAAGVLVLLIACVNITSLLLARSAARIREVAIRSAIGAGRLRVFRQLLVENLLLSLAGGAAGLLLARWGVAVLVRISPYAIPRLAEARIDARVAGFTLAISLAAAVVFGAVAAMACRRANLQLALKENARATGGWMGARVRRVLMATELALAIVLLAGAALMAKSLARMNRHPAGFAPEKIATMQVRLAGPRNRTDAAQDAYVREVLRLLREDGALNQAGISNWVLFSNGPEFPTGPVRRAPTVIRINAVSPGYLRALGMRLVKGRWLGDDDSGVLLNESMARQAFGDLDPVGRQIEVPRAATVVGVVADLKYFRLDEVAAPEAFVAWQRIPPRFNMAIAARAVGEAGAAARVLARRIAELDGTQPVFDVKTLEEALADALAPRRFQMFLLGSFAAVALALALVGIYGVMAYSVAERTREIGVRMALGARRGQVMGMVLREAALVAGAGMACGLAAAWGATRAMASLLYGVAPDDPWVFAAVAAVLGVTAMGACMGPALRAASVDAAVALRWE